MAVLSSLVVQLALESASFQQGLRSARTELKTFSREAGQVARVGRDFNQVARGADALATSLGAVSPKLGDMAQTAVHATVAARGLAGAIGLIASPAAAAVAAVAGLGLVIGRVVGNVLLTLPVIDQFTSKLAGIQAAGQAAVIKREALGITPKDFADRAEAAAKLAQRLREIGAQLATLQAAGPIRVAAIEAEGGGDAIRALELRQQAAVAQIRGELSERLAAAAQIGRHQAEVEQLRVLAVEQANQQIAEADAILTAERRRLMESFVQDAVAILARLGAGFEAATQRVTIDVALRRAQQEIRTLQEIFRPEELARAIFRISEELLTLGATSAQITQTLGDDFARFAASVAPIPADIKAMAEEAKTLGTTGAVAGAGVTAMNQALATTAVTAAAATVGLVAVTAAAQEAARAASGFSSSTQGFFGGEVQLPSTGGGFSPGAKLPSEGGGFFPGSRRFEHGGVVPGPSSRAVPILAHGGETIVPAGESAGAPIIHFSFNAPLFVDNDRRMKALALRLWEHVRDAQRRHAR